MAAGPAWLNLHIKLTSRNSAYIKDQLLRADTVGSQLVDGRATRHAIVNIGKMLVACAAGIMSSKIFVSVLNDSGTSSEGEIACTRANAAGNYVRFTYGTLTITLTEGVDFVRGASDTTCGTNLAAAINAHAVLKSLFTATDDTGTVTITAKMPGKATEAIVMSTDDATAFALTQLTGGTVGTARVFPQQVWTSKTP